MNPNHKPLPFKHLAIFITLIMGILVIANIYISASLSTSGAKINQLENESRLLTEQNTDLKRQILSHSALSHLEKNALELGYLPPQQVVKINLNPAIALSLP